MSMVFDGFRMWRDWGTWSVEGMSWEQVWDKYETQILQEMLEECEDDDGSIYRYCIDETEEECCIIDLNESSVQEEITAQICLRILERSCGTNTFVDRLLLENDKDNDITASDIITSSNINENIENDANILTRRKKKRILSKFITTPDISGDKGIQRKLKRRRRNAERDLASIRNRLEKDIQELLE